MGACDVLVCRGGAFARNDERGARLGVRKEKKKELSGRVKKRILRREKGKLGKRKSEEREGERKERERKERGVKRKGGYSVANIRNDKRGACVPGNRSKGGEREGKGRVRKGKVREREEEERKGKKRKERKEKGKKAKGK